MQNCRGGGDCCGPNNLQSLSSLVAEDVLIFTANVSVLNMFNVCNIFTEEWCYKNIVFKYCILAFCLKPGLDDLRRTVFIDVYFAWEAEKGGYSLHYDEA